MGYAMIDEQLRRALDRRRQRGILRELKRFKTIRQAEGPINNASTIASTSDASLVDFSSNDYMGLARCADMKQSVIQKMQGNLYTTLGSTGSRLLDGNSRHHEELEERLAQHFASSTALLFNSGYDANTSLLSVLPQPDDVILYDELAHASMHDGMRASRTSTEHRIGFAHNDMTDLARKLDDVLRTNACKHANVFVAVEAVYSMDGDSCPLRRLAAVVDERVPRARRRIIVDEAHAVGLYGLNGTGLCEAMGASAMVDIRLITFGKAFGCSGAAVLCESIVRHYLINYARPLIYSTAIPHPSLMAIDSALDILSTPAGSLRATHTFAMTQNFIDRLYAVLSEAAVHGRQLAISLPSEVVQRCRHEADCPTDAFALPPPPIVPIITAKAHELAGILTQNGFLVRPISYPTVPKGMERVRVCIHAHNTLEEVSELVRCIQEWVRSQPIDAIPASYASEKAKL